MTSESPRKPTTPSDSGVIPSDDQRDGETPATPLRSGEQSQKWYQEGRWRVYGPYPKRTGANIYLREVLLANDGTGDRDERYIGKVGRVDVDTVHVDADVPTSLIDDVAHAVQYVEQLNLSKRRIADPVRRLLRHLGLQFYTDEKI